MARLEAVAPMDLQVNHATVVAYAILLSVDEAHCAAVPVEIAATSAANAVDLHSNPGFAVKPYADGKHYQPNVQTPHDAVVPVLEPVYRARHYTSSPSEQSLASAHYKLVSM